MMEMLVSLFLIVIILAIAAVSIESVSDESRLQHPAVEMKAFAKKAVKSAIAEQRSYSIFLYPRFFLMRETYPEIIEEEEEDYGFALFDDEDDVPPVRTVVTIRHDLGSDVGLEVKRWNSKEWIVPQEEEWVFAPSGLCEPLSIRFTRKDGYIEIDFNPLTAGVQDERLYVP